MTSKLLNKHMIHKISTLAKNLTILSVFVPFFSAQALQIGDGQDVITQDNTGKKEAISVSDESSTVDINITNPLDNQLCLKLDRNLV